MNRQAAALKMTFGEHATAPGVGELHTGLARACEPAERLPMDRPATA
jgi:hypothetical protein